MTTIPLPPNRRTLLQATGLLLCVICLILICQIVWSWRLTAAGVFLLSGALLWWRHLQQRPASIVIGPSGELCCTLGNGQSFEVAHILPGVIRPALVSTRLESPAGKYCNLFVPAHTLSDTAHWQLRRALIEFRPRQVDERRGV